MVNYLRERILHRALVLEEGNDMTYNTSALRADAQRLNEISDQVNQQLSSLTLFLKELRAGVEAHCRVTVGNQTLDFGYVKVNGQWGLAWRTATDSGVCGSWTDLASAPRSLRLALCTGNCIHSLIDAVHKEIRITAMQAKTALLRVKQTVAELQEKK